MSNPGRSRPRATLTHVARTRLIIARTGVGGELLNGATIDMPPIRQTSVMYKRAPKATYLLEGSVRAEADRWRLTVRLIPLPEQVHTWSASYDGRPNSMLEWQRELSEAIAGRSA